MRSATSVATLERGLPRAVPERFTNRLRLLADRDEQAWNANASTSRLAQVTSRVRFAATFYLATRALLLVLAGVETQLMHAGFANELGNWDGVWYLRIMEAGFPTHTSHLQTTLGFFPLYPMVSYALEHVLFCSAEVAALLVAGIGGFVATVLIQQLATSWWGAPAGRRAVVLFCCFPGSIVFSMVYSEGLLVPLVAGCFLLLARRQYLTAGVLAGLATAVGPDAVAILPAMAFAALRELRASGWRAPTTRRALGGLALAPLGIIGFGIFLKLWTGTPFASYDAQHYGWGERTDVAALVHQGQVLANEISFAHFNYHAVNLNYLLGLAGAAFGLVGLVLLARRQNRIPIEALLYTLAMAFLTATSEFTPPNPRLLIAAFPIVLVFAKVCQGRAFRVLVALNLVLLVGLSYLTFVGISLRP